MLTESIVLKNSPEYKIIFEKGGIDRIKRQSAFCSRVPFFIVEKSADMRYNKLLNFSGVTGITF